MKDDPLCLDMTFEQFMALHDSANPQCPAARDGYWEGCHAVYAEWQAQRQRS